MMDGSAAEALLQNGRKSSQVLGSVSRDIALQCGPACPTCHLVS